MSCIYYVYAYISQRTKLPYYIGKGKDDRITQNHFHIPVPKDKSRIVFLETNLTELGAFALERRYIKWYGRRNDSSGILLNRADGGSGASGWILTEDHKKKLLKANLGRKMPADAVRRTTEAARNRSMEYRRKMSEVKTNPSPETRAKQSLAAKNHWAKIKQMRKTSLAS